MIQATHLSSGKQLKQQPEKEMDGNPFLNLKTKNMDKNQKIEQEIQNAMSVIELEERQEMTVANEALCCGDNGGCNSGCTKTATPTTDGAAPAPTT